MDIYLEVGQKKAAGYSLEWPGWCRLARSGAETIQALRDYVPRYRVIAQRAEQNFEPDAFVITEVAGDANTDWGVPAIVVPADLEPIDEKRARKRVALLRAAWMVMDEVVASSPAQLRKGPRGGGRDRDKIASHVIEAERSYARKIGVRHKPFSHDDLSALTAMREEIADVLSRPSDGSPLAPGGWSASYAIRRIAWHVTDHIWEIEDKRQ
jgi:hypothetical protein